MIVRTNEGNFQDEVFQIKIDVEETKIKSSPLQELTDEFFIKRAIFENDEIKLGTGIEKSDLIGITLTELD